MVCAGGTLYCDGGVLLDTTVVRSIFLDILYYVLTGRLTVVT